VGSSVPPSAGPVACAGFDVVFEEGFESGLYGSGVEDSSVVVAMGGGSFV